MLNKKAALGGQTMIYVFLLSLFIIAVGIALGVGMFFGEEFDFREADALNLKTEVLSCIKEKALDLESKEKFSEEFFTRCRINEQAINSGNYIYLEINDEEFFEVGPIDKTQCELGKKSQEYPRCVEETINVKDKKIFILTGANQKARKIRA